MTLPQLITAYHETTNITEEESFEAIDTLFEVSPHLVESDFANKHITQKDAEAIALSNRYFIHEYLEYYEFPFDIITPTIDRSTKDMAYYLANSEPSTATDLLNELLYWHKQGRI